MLRHLRGLTPPPNPLPQGEGEYSSTAPSYPDAHGAKPRPCFLHPVALPLACSWVAPAPRPALQPRGKMMTPSIPQDARIRVVGDVHGDAAAFAYAAATDRFVVQLGDLTDYGPDSAGTLRIMFGLIDAARGLFLLGNHDLKLAAPWPAGRCGSIPWCRRQSSNSTTNCASAPCGRSRAPRPGCGMATRSSCMAASTPTMLEQPPRSHGLAAAGPRGPRAVRRADRPHPARRLSGAQPALGGPHPGRGDGLLRPRPAQHRRAAVRAGGRLGGWRCSSTPAPARAAICPGSTCSQGRRVTAEGRGRDRRRRRRRPH